MSINLHNQEIKNHIRYLIYWDEIDEAEFSKADEEDPDDGPQIGKSKLWKVCVNRLKRSKNPESYKAPRLSKHLHDEEVLRLRLIGPSKSTQLSRGELIKLKKHFTSYPQTVDRSDSDGSDDFENTATQGEGTINIRKIGRNVLSWYGCTTAQGQVIRPPPTKITRQHTRDASYVTYTNDYEVYACGRVIKVITLRFAGSIHALAYIQNLNLDHEQLALASLKKGHASKGHSCFIKLTQLQELIGLLNKNGRTYIVRRRTAYFPK
ncbi:hypothetical protein BDZ91DRAFT_357655 [Kalaharituber pfeilii]|nr:hypothetical protein BDZ91DRAFT_357655 [Kalaharituber pfeilii]